MPRRAELEEAVRNAAERRETVLMEALYVLSVVDGEYLARYNLRLRYNRPVEVAESLRAAAEVLGAVEALDSEGAVTGALTIDTGESCRDVVKAACERYLGGLEAAVEQACAGLSRRGRQLAVLLLREGGVRNGEVYDSGSGFALAHRIVFGEDLLPEAFEELIGAGLLYNAYDGKKYVVPSFARRAWAYGLDRLVPLPRLRVEWPTGERD